MIEYFIDIIMPKAKEFAADERARFFQQEKDGKLMKETAESLQRPLRTVYNCIKQGTGLKSEQRSGLPRKTTFKTERPRSQERSIFRR